MTKQPLLIYLHGFNSSPDSHKAQITCQFVDQQRLDIDTWVPQLPNEPLSIQELLLDRLRLETSKRPVHIIGSSLGGFIGTWLSELIHEVYPSWPVRLVLINPAVRPYEFFEAYLGWQTNYHTGEKWLLTHEHIQQFKNMEVPVLSLHNQTLLLVQTGDEVLDYRKAVAKYAGADSVVQQGGNHQFEDYEKTLPYIFEFLAGHSLI
ncbi:esterase YqiA [Endozoicomonas sp. OPT23]|uniref:YqiA/YcfP family alpha/beta fold hydrolase n=1 Tax=Endozoicomonas sp. OPT23 TaxID=2072845 RepID=UPI00129A63E5|nr:YqiA/YcfP family alpha/beta fold hydrolase [Endozoicomonas sp. OPT23]MRI32577.1 esterase YqiA [Endozoicomonas sp. OPT23]